MKHKFEKLDLAFKKEWVETLRSGKYKQGTKFLYSHITNDYCCLGVGGLVLGIPKEKMKHLGTFNQSLNEIYCNLIPNQLSGEMMENPVVEALTSLNDGQISFVNHSGK